MLIDNSQKNSELDGAPYKGTAREGLSWFAT